MITGSIICTVITPLKRNHMVYENPIYYVITPCDHPMSPLYTYEIVSRPAAEHGAALATDCGDGSAGVHARRFDMYRWVTVHIKAMCMDPCTAP